MMLDHIEFKEVKAGHWETPVMHDYLMQCCDCGLVHRLNFRVIKPMKKKKGRAVIQGSSYIVQMQAYRADADGD